MSTKKTIQIFSLINSSMAISPEDGEKLYQEMITNLDTGNTIEIDFQKIDIIVSSFLNSSIGRLYGTQYKDALDNGQIKIINMTEQDKATLSLVIKRAKEFFGK